MKYIKRPIDSCVSSSPCNCGALAPKCIVMIVFCCFHAVFLKQSVYLILQYCRYKEISNGGGDAYESYLRSRIQFSISQRLQAAGKFSVTCKFVRSVLVIKFTAQISLQFLTECTQMHKNRIILVPSDFDIFLFSH